VLGSRSNIILLIFDFTHVFNVVAHLLNIFII
jgi:hypothetical protein